MNEELIEKLTEAIETGEVLSIIYHGGSQPGAVRQLSPIKVTHREVRAREIETGIVKTFLVAKIELAGGQTTARRYVPEEGNNINEPASIQEAFQNEVEELESLGWHVQLEEDSISLHRYFKNGKPLKGSDVSLYFDEYTSDFVVDLDGELQEENVRKKQKPWMVRAKGINTRSYSSLYKAANLFIEQANRLAPNSK